MVTNKEKLIEALFGSPQKTHVDVKFLLARNLDLTEEAFCQQATQMLLQMDEGLADTEFLENFEQRNVSDFLASLPAQGI